MPTKDVELTVNGELYELSVEPRRLLVHTLRDALGCTGVKIGCDTSLCGACTVHLDGKPIKACTAFTVQADGCDITTVEGLGEDGDLHPIQEKFHEEHSLQCGYCTPGILLTSINLVQENEDLNRTEIREGLKGNLCRCTGYQNIIDAVEATAEAVHNG